MGCDSTHCQRRHQNTSSCHLLSLHPTLWKQQDCEVCLITAEHQSLSYKECCSDKSPNGRWILWQKVIKNVHYSPLNPKNSAGRKCICAAKQMCSVAQSLFFMCGEEEVSVFESNTETVGVHLIEGTRLKKRKSCNKWRSVWMTMWCRQMRDWRHFLFVC